MILTTREFLESVDSMKTERKVLMKEEREKRRRGRISGSGEPFFAMLPQNIWTVMHERNLPYAARLLYFAIAQFSGDGESPYPSMSTLCEMTGFGGGRLLQVRKILEDARMLQVVHRRNNSNVYILAKWKSEVKWKLWSLVWDYAREVDYRPAKLALIALARCWCQRDVATMRVLTKMTGLSRSPLRKALRRLIAEGIAICSVGGGRKRCAVYKMIGHLWSEKGVYNVGY